MEKTPIFAVLAAGSMWGSMGMFTRLLRGAGLDTLDIVLVRSGVAMLLYAAVVLIRNPKLFRFRPCHIWCFVGSGICGTLFFSVCYFTAISLIGLSSAAILQYTSPFIVTILAIFLFHEKLTWQKLFALILAFSGCILVSAPGGEIRFSVFGLFCGLGAGFGYALLTIFSRLAVDRGYDGLTINFYTCLFAALGAVLISGGTPVRFAVSTWNNGLLCLSTGLLSCFLPSTLYVYGLSRIDAGKASILASFELIVAMLTDVLFLGQPMSLPLCAGAILILFSVAILTVPAKRKRPPTDE